MKASNKSLIALLTLATALSACEMKRNLDEMHDSTKEMNQTTQEMNQTTAEMNKRTTGLEVATGELYDALRQGDSLAARRAALDNLIKTDDAGRKLSEAAKYFMSFEFQFWMNSNQDAGEEKRLVLATMAAREFFKDIYQFIPAGEMTADPFSGQIFSRKKTNLVNCLNSLSVTTQFLNPKQEKFLKENPEVSPLSMQTMIEESLLAKHSIESGQKTINDYPGYVAEVLANEQAVIYLLEARYNYFMTLFLARATKIAYDKVDAAKYILFKWNLDLNKFNTVQIEEFNFLLTGALKTKSFLLSVGVKPKTETLLQRMLKNVTLKELSVEAKSNTAKVQGFNEVSEKLTELKKF